MNHPVIFRMSEDERLAAIKKAEDAARASLVKLLEESSAGVSPSKAPGNRWLRVSLRALRRGDALLLRLRITPPQIRTEVCVPRLIRIRELVQGKQRE
jgi:hypothetical protein